MKTYHVALSKGSGRCYPLHRNGARADTLVIHAERCIDFLPPGIWKYCGERETTKAELRRRAADILGAVNSGEGTSFNRAVVR